MSWKLDPKRAFFNKVMFSAPQNTLACLVYAQQTTKISTRYSPFDMYDKPTVEIHL
jgi:hypothetical protein